MLRTDYSVKAGKRRGMRLKARIKGFMNLFSVYCWRYPSTVEEYERRKAAGEKIAWFK